MKIRFVGTVAIVAAGAGLLCACATERTKQDARQDYERSVADYENCLAANQMSACEGERRSMEAHKRALSGTVRRPGR
jgi:hypothetical protein